jgi:sarcosine oxidase, subunit beta
MTQPDSADLVIVGGGTIGGWASVFARRNGANRVVVVDRGTVGQGASSRAAGIVRAQGGTPAAVQLGRWSIDFYRRQAEESGVDSGFREQGYLLLAVTDADVRQAQERLAMQRGEGLDVRWVDPDEVARLNPTLSAGVHLGATYREGDGFIDPPRNVLAYRVAMARSGVDLRERTELIGLRTARSADGRRVTGVETASGTIPAGRVLLTGGPELREVGRRAGIAIPAGAVRHQVAVTEPHEAFDRDRLPMVFDVGAGLYWRLEEGGLLFGMSNPDEPPGPAREVDWDYMELMRKRLAEFVPVTEGLGLRKVWAATIDYTPDHLPIIGPGIAPDGSRIDGVTVASAGGHGMMWGPAVSRAATDIALEGETNVVDVADLGLDRFDAQGRSRLAPDSIALPFPTETGEPSARDSIPSRLRGPDQKDADPAPSD